MSPTLAVIVAEPSALAVTFPPLSTDATEGLELVHVTVLFVALSGDTVATNISVLPILSEREVLLSVTPVTGTAFLLTVTEQDAILPPALAEITVFPSEMAMTLPLSSTEATEATDEAQTTAL